MRVKRLEDTDRDAWDRYVRQAPGSSPYQLYAWGRSVAEAYGHTMHYLVAENGPTITGVLPLMMLKPPVLSGRLVSLPFCDTGGPLADSAEVERALAAECVQTGARLGAGSIEVRCAKPATAWPEEFRQAAVKTHKVLMVLDLPQSSVELMNGFASKLRSQIRKACKHDLDFRLGDSECLDGFYSVFSRNMKELGSPVHSRKLFEAVIRNFGGLAKIGLVCRDGEPIGAGLILCHQGTITIPWASTLRKFNNLAPNMLLYWKLLEYAADSGYQSFCFGRSTPGEGTYNFKKQWGAQPRQLHWYVNSPGRHNSPDRETKGGSRAFIEAVWRRLPLGMANTIGPSIRKYISL